MQRGATSIFFSARLRRALAARRRHHLVVDVVLVLERDAREQRAQVLAPRGLALGLLEPLARRLLLQPRPRPLPLPGAARAESLPFARAAESNPWPFGACRAAVSAFSCAYFAATAFSTASPLVVLEKNDEMEVKPRAGFDAAEAAEAGGSSISIRITGCAGRTRNRAEKGGRKGAEKGAQHAFLAGNDLSTWWAGNFCFNFRCSVHQ